MRLALDTNCFIDAVDIGSHAHAAMHRIGGEPGGDEGQRRGAILGGDDERPAAIRDEPAARAALEIALSCVQIVHYPIGSWADAKRNQAIQFELRTLAKPGSSIRDRGAYIDALLDGADAFLTSDAQLAKSGPAQRIQARFGLKVVRPIDYAANVDLPRVPPPLNGPPVPVSPAAAPKQR